MRYRASSDLIFRSTTGRGREGVGQKYLWEGRGGSKTADFCVRTFCTNPNAGLYYRPGFYIKTVTALNEFSSIGCTLLGVVHKGRPRTGAGVRAMRTSATRPKIGWKTPKTVENRAKNVKILSFSASMHTLLTCPLSLPSDTFSEHLRP